MISCLVSVWILEYRDAGCQMIHNARSEAFFLNDEQNVGIEWQDEVTPSTGRDSDNALGLT